jgi:hypothetical protein
VAIRAVPFKALTIRQPYASLIIAGVKDVENRTWMTSHRGPLVIHAGRNVDRRGPQAAQAWEAVENLGLDVPTGVVLGVVELIDVIEGVNSVWAIPNHWHWVLGHPRPLAHPLPMPGRLGLWTVEL